MKNCKQLLLILLFSISAQIYSQNEKFLKQKIENKIEFEASIDSVWTYLSNLGNLQNLVPSTIEKSVLVGNGKGSIVTLTLKNNKGTIIEEVIELDNKKRIISYTMIETPMPIKKYIASFEVKQVDNKKVQVVFKATFRVQEKNKEARINAFNNLQLELLRNIKEIKNEK
jgi:Polyketide cyclase / dehydrase and lipid transport